MKIVHPKRITKSPGKLAEDMGVEAMTVEDGFSSWRDGPGGDFFMFYPDPDRVGGVTDKYRLLRAFYKQEKYGQRRSLKKELGDCVLPSYRTHEAAEMLPPNALGYVVRPLQHEKGEGYRKTDNPVDFREGADYVAPVFGKTHEYRVVFVHGKLAFMQKKEGGDLGPADCWSNVDFTYIRHPERAFLTLRTDFFEQVKKSFPIMNACIVGVDVLYNNDTREYRICEVNTCPTLLAPTYAEGRELRGKIISIAKEFHQ
jgi:hypothetical protein